MTENEFDGQWKHIEEQYAARRETAHAYRDQEIAKLFNESGWTQECIAAHLTKLTGKSIKRRYIAYRLVFGRFLVFGTICAKTVLNLTEGRFRDYWQRTSGNEDERFAAIASITAAA